MLNRWFVLGAIGTVGEGAAEVAETVLDQAFGGAGSIARGWRGCGRGGRVDEVVDGVESTQHRGRGRCASVADASRTSDGDSGGTWSWGLRAMRCCALLGALAGLCVPSRQRSGASFFTPEVSAPHRRQCFEREVGMQS